MRYTILHGAKENSGDFLIRDSAAELLKHHTGVSEDEIYYIDIVRSELSQSQINQIAETEAAFLAGGPGYRQAFYPETYPALNDILNVTTLALLGPGWKGQNEDEYTLADQSVNLLKKITEQPTVPYLGARDLPSVRILRKHGLPAELTGCPSWYYYDGFPPDPSFNISDSVENILISTPPRDDIRYLIQYAALIRILDAEFPSAQLVLVFHRGQHKRAFKPINGRPWRVHTWKNNTSSILYGIIKTIANQYGCKLYDASGSSEYARSYFEADLHVGYRVHAHIPALSAGTPSFLIQIDGRGKGVSESLGTSADVFGGNKLRKPIYNIYDNIQSNIATDFSDFKDVSQNIKGCYKWMSELIHETTQTECVSNQTSRKRRS